MGSFFRSEEMALAQLFIQPEAAYFVISELGETGTVQFRDLNENINSFQRKFVNEVRRCDEMERKLRYIEAEVNKDKVNIPDVKELPRAPNPREIIDLEAHLEKTEGDIKEFSESATNLKSNFLELTELKHVLEKTQLFFNEQDEVVSGIDNKALINEESTAVTGRGRLGFIAGVIKRERIPAFERMLWRISRGNIFLRQADIGIPLEDPLTGNEINKTVFVAFFQGEQLKSRIKKVCAGFHASMFHCPNTIQERDEMLKGVKLRLKDLEMVLNQTKDHRQRVLVSVAKELQNWSIMVSKMKAIYHTLNFFNVDVTKKCLIGECWVPVADIAVVQKALVDGSSVSGSSIPSFMNTIATSENPPTFNRTNKFTRGFQNLIDAYGVSSYREVNPALYTCITFPFLFAIMFGDVGHAIIMFGFAFYMVMCEKSIAAIKNKGEIANIFFAGRYIILLMSLFSMYTGFIYNDIFAKSMNIFGSSWKIRSDLDHELLNRTMTTLDPIYQYTGEPYPFGIDPIWQLAKNKIIFLNSFKMKLSIIFGVIHMIFGVCMSIPNYVHFKKTSDIFLQFIPQIVFLCSIFFYLVVMLFIKSFKYYANKEFQTLDSQCAPSVLIYFINMMLMKPQDEHPPCQPYMFDLQPTLQRILVGIGLCMIPIMLFGKPIMFKMTHGKKEKRNSTFSRNGAVRQSQVQSLELTKVTHNNKENSETNENGNVDEDRNSHHETEVVFKPTPKKKDHEEHGEDEFSELMIHQALHTVEYILSTVSHTASYLRLWALSLAHSQLSEVLWTLIFANGFTSPAGYTGAIPIFILFAVWASLSVAILVLMEGLSAFLHTLRLHWVEFMSKFYTGEGYAFQPFSFKTILETEEQE